MSDRLVPIQFLVALLFTYRDTTAELACVGTSSRSSRVILFESESISLESMTHSVCVDLKGKVEGMSQSLDKVLIGRMTLPFRQLSIMIRMNDLCKKGNDDTNRALVPTGMTKHGR